MGAEITKKITLDVARKNNTTISHAAQYDRLSRYFLVTLECAGETFEVDTTSLVVVSYCRPKLGSDTQSSDYQQSFSGSVENGKAKIPLPYWAVERSGLVRGNISLFGTDESGNATRLSTLSFIVTVEASPYNETDYTEDESAETLVLQLVAQVSQTNKLAISAIDECYQAIDEMQEWMDNFTIEADDLGLEQDEATGYVYPTYKGVRSENGIPLAVSGGGGSGSGGASTASYTITLTNLLENRSFSVANGGAAVVKFNYASVDSDGYDDGTGICSVIVDSVTKATLNIQQGENTLDITRYLSIGTNNIKIKVENSEGLSKSLNYTVIIVSLTISTTFSDFTQCSGNTIFYYTPTGTGDKTIYFYMDGALLDTAIVKTSGRSQSFVIPEQNHGAHIFECYAEAEIDGVAVRSDVLTLAMYWVGDSTDAIVQILFEDTTGVEQGETLSIPYLVYSPQSESANITLTVLNEDGTEYSSQMLTVDRTAQVWTVTDYPAGEVTFRITCGKTSNERTVEVTQTELDLSVITDSLALAFNPTGRSNNESEPATWTDGTTTAEFSGVNFISADGWLTDDSGVSVLRLLPGEQMTIPLTFFSSDKRVTGATIEVEAATHNVQDYDAIVISCLSGGKGIKIASQYMQMNSEQSELSVQFKENERVRLSLVIEPYTLNRLIYVYVDGVMCGAIQYPTDDDFSQNPAVGITVGAETSGIDIYRVYFYNKGLTRAEIVDNYIADRSTLAERKEKFNLNQVLGDDGTVSYTKLSADLPYMIISCAELPQYKGDKKTCAIEYIDNADATKSFAAEGVSIDVQGTSSAGYKKKNFKFTLKDGLTYTATGSVSETYALRDDSIPVDSFCMKADVASSEGANNVELVRLYNDVSPYKTAAQEIDGRVRVGIDGKPCVLFWYNTNDGTVSFWGKYNFNNDKSTEAVYGLTDGCESWEILNNTSGRCLFKKSDYSSDDWLNDFEARYPEDNTDYTHLKRMTDWVASTDRSTVSTNEEKAALLEKFKSEFEEYFVKEPMLFYYVFTEVFLMVDSRAKNLFPTTYDGVHWLPLPYDFDTALGINNEGQLVFDYDLEDTDKVDGANVFNGQESVLWCNIRDAFPEEIKAIYQELRSGALFNYDKIIERFREHQRVYPETVWNEDAYEKYLEPLIDDNDSSYLTMLQGNKASQREWWLYNAMRYRDSKYQTGDASNNFITLRCYAKDDITVTSYSHIWARIKYGSYTVMERIKRNSPATLVCPVDTMNDTEVYIYSADRLTDVGDLSGIQVGYADFSMATKLQSLKLGDAADGYENTHLTELYVGNNDALTSLDVRHCTALTATVDLSACDCLEAVYAGGSSIPALTLPVGGNVKILELPATITNLTICNQTKMERVTLEGYENLSTLRIENTPNVPLSEILTNAPLTRVRIFNVDIDLTGTYVSLQSFINKLLSCYGLDANGLNTDIAVVTGTVRTDSVVSDELLVTINENFPDLTVIADDVPQYSAVVKDADGNILYSTTVQKGETFSVSLGDYIGTTGAMIDNVSVTRDGIDYEDYDYDEATTMFKVESVTGYVVITLDIILPTLATPTVTVENHLLTVDNIPDGAATLIIYVDNAAYTSKTI